MIDVLAAESSNDLIKVVPGLMIWTLIAFGITFFVLKKFAFGPIQKTIDARRDRNAFRKGRHLARLEGHIHFRVKALPRIDDMPALQHQIIRRHAASDYPWRNWRRLPG